MKSEDDQSARCPNPYALTIPTQSLLRIRISASEAVCGIKVIVKVLTRHCPAPISCHGGKSRHSVASVANARPLPASQTSPAFPEISRGAVRAK